MQTEEGTLPAESLIGGRYRVLGQLAAGSGVSTRKVLDTRDTRVCILKTLSLDSLSHWKRLELFKREARTLAHLEHAQIPALLDYFETRTDHSLDCHLVTEKVPGKTLAEHLRTGRHFDEQAVYLIAVQVLTILDYLHRFQPPVIHRDIKPSNIMLDEQGQIYLIDFGGVQEALAIGAGGSTMIGTYGYMAPEQFAGRALPQSDLYGLGATLVHLLARREPANLPRRDLLLGFRPYVECSERFANWLEQMLLPASEQRFSQAWLALEVLQEILPDYRHLSIPGAQARRPARPDRELAEQLEQLQKDSHEPENALMPEGTRLMQPGTQLTERYEIEALLGQGESALTYSARRLSDGTAVVIRELHFDRISHWKSYELFERELKALSRLQHSALPSLLEHFELKEGGRHCFYLVSRRIEADNLAVRLRQGWRPLESEIRQLADQLLAILEFLQRQSPPLIHRDIKPSNLLLDKTGKLYLIDFGSVKEAFRPTGGGGSTVIGSYGYMAPEQALGQAVPASDLYAAGATLIHLLTGHPPSELAHQGLQIQFSNQARCSRQLLIWLEKMVAPALTQRYDSPGLAREQLARLDRLPVMSEQLQAQGERLLGAGSRAIEIKDGFDGLSITLRPMYYDYQRLLPALVSGNAMGIPFFLALQVPLSSLLAVLMPIYSAMLIHYLMGRGSSFETVINLDPEMFSYRVQHQPAGRKAVETVERIEYPTSFIRDFGLENTDISHRLSIKIQGNPGQALLWRVSQFPLMGNARKAAYLVERLQETLVLYQRQGRNTHP